LVLVHANSTIGASGTFEATVEEPRHINEKAASQVSRALEILNISGVAHKA
jgi:hypothetical protein